MNVGLKMSKIRDISVFLASPNDVKTERQRVERVVVRLNQKFAGLARFQVIRYEHGFYPAHRHPQDEIANPAECDIVIVFFGGRLGSEMHDDFSKRMSGGERYPSGTAYELLAAIAAAEINGGRPSVYIFRSTFEPQFRLSETEQSQAAQREKERLDSFFQRHFSTLDGQPRRIVHRFDDPDDLATQVNELLLQWAGLSLRSAPGWLIERDGSPFRGLEQFDASHSRVYFGRDRKVQRATDELLAARARTNGLPFLLVVGPSGSGKSSLVRAGLVPLLTGGNAVGEVDAWRVAVMKPSGAGAASFSALAHALFVDGSEEADPGGLGKALPELAAVGHGSAAALATALDAAPQAAAEPVLAALEQAAHSEQEAGGFRREVRVDLLLVVDQLEEVFAEDVGGAVRTGFARLLTALAQCGRVWIVATLRADLYSSMLDQTSPFLALKDAGGLYDLASPGPAELSEILEKSAAAAGLVYEDDPKTGDKLDERLLADATGSDALPLLQFSLKKLFDARQVIETPEGRSVRLTFAAYDELKGMDGAVDTVAEETIRAEAPTLTDAVIERALARMLRHMVTRIGHAPDRAVGGQPGLTMRPMPLAAATADTSSRLLVDTFVQARLLVLISGEDRIPLVRFAHERVLTSWRRARSIVEAHREFFRVRADMEVQYARWDAGKRRREFLLRGVPLTDAKGVERDFGDELPLGLRDFVTASIRRDRFGRRVAAGLMTTFATLAVVATTFAALASSAQYRAGRNFEAATGAANELVVAIPQGLRQKKGIPIEVLNVAFLSIDQLLDKMQRAVLTKDQGLLGNLETVVDAGQRLFPGPSASAQLATLERSRADLYYEFAEIYHQADGGSTSDARGKAVTSLEIRERLRTAGAVDVGLQLGIAKSEIQIADFDRKKVDDAKATDYGPARKRFDRARRLLEPLAALEPDRMELPYWLGQVLTRLGDIDRKTGALDAAESDYAQAKSFTMTVYRATPNDPRAVRELGWSYRKLAEMRAAYKDYDGELRFLETEVCIRRKSAAMEPNDLLKAADVGYGLWNLGISWLRNRALEEGAYDTVYEALHRRLSIVEADRSTEIPYRRLADSLAQVGELHRGRNDPVLAEAFAQAAVDVTRRIGEAFPADHLPADQAAATFARNQANALRRNGVLAMINQPARTMVENAENEFTLSRLPVVEIAVANCWDTVLTADVASFGKP